LHSISLGLANQFVKITTPLHPSAALTRTSVTFGCAYLSLQNTISHELHGKFF
jgi:hypothetical protein